MNVLNSDQNNNENNVNVVPELFSKELEEILQKIFLFLDPKSLKNSKLTCSWWREFIDTRISRSPSARNVLHGRLSANWKNGDQVKVSKVRLDFYPSIAVCDDAVMVFGDEDTGRCRVLNSSIHELLYDTTLHPLHPLVDDISIGQDFICFFSHNLFVTIVDKFTGNTEFKEVMDDQNYSVKMIGNIIFADNWMEIFLFSPPRIQRHLNGPKKSRKLESIMMMSIHISVYLEVKTISL